VRGVWEGVGVLDGVGLGGGVVRSRRKKRHGAEWKVQVLEGSSGNTVNGSSG